MRTFLAISVSFFSSVSVSQEPADTLKMYHQPPVVITATRLEQRLHEVGRNVSVISADQLGISIHNSIGDALSQQQGLYVVGAGQNYGMLQSFFLRGAGNNQTAVLVDGVRITDPSTVNNAIDGSELSLGGVERIEIVRGPHSTLFGSSAIGGIINLISQTPSRMGIHADATVGAGLFGSGTSLFSQEVNVSALDESGFYAVADVKHMNSRGLDATVDTVTNPSTFKRRDRDDFEKTYLMAKAGYRSDIWEVFAGYRQGVQQAGIDKEAFIDDDNYKLSFRRQLLTYGSSLGLTKGLKVRYIGGYSTMNRDAENDSSVVSNSGDTDHLFTEDHYKGSTTTHELQVEFDVENVTGVLGLGWYKETMNARNRLFFSGFESIADVDTIQPSSNTLSLFAHAAIQGTSISESLRRLTMGVGIRTDQNNRFGSMLTFDINPSFKVSDEGMLFAVYSRGFNAPSLYQLFSPEPHYLSSITRGNGNLQAEESRSIEIGCKYADDILSFSVSAFHIRTDNSIEFVYLWDKAIGMDTLGNDWMRDDNRGNTYLNVGTQISRGIEFNIDASLFENLQVSANFSLLGGKLLYSPSRVDVSKTESHHVQLYSNGAFLNREVDVAKLVRRPNTANVTVRYEPFAEWLLALSIRSVGKRNDVYYDSQLGPYGALATTEVDSYTLADLSQRIEITDRLVFRAKVENILNTRYSEIRGFSTRGRGLYVGMQYSMR